MESVFSIRKPQNPSPLVLDSPHSGTLYPADFNYVLDLNEMRSVEDRFVDELFEGAPDLGAAFLCAHFPRSYIDVNRDAADVDESLLSEPWPEDEYGVLWPSLRSRNGIGLVFREIPFRQKIYDRQLTPQEVMARIEEYYNPYHKALKTLIDQAHQSFGNAWHINCHSMPARAANPFMPRASQGTARKPIEFVIGNRDGLSAGRDFTYTLRDIIQGLGYTVSINDPFKGLELIERYSNPQQGRQSLQLEVNKAIYMDEETHEKSADFEAVKADMDRVVQATRRYIDSELMPIAAH